MCARRSSGRRAREPLCVWHRDSELPAADLIVLPGGFAYGDYLRCGAMAAHSPIMREVKARAERGTPVLGICNGFQVLTEAGMLPGALLPNRSLSFICRDVHLRVENNQTIFTCGYDAGQTIRVPVAHHDGNYTADAATLDRLGGSRPRRLPLLQRRGRPDRRTTMSTARPARSPASSTTAAPSSA